MKECTLCFRTLDADQFYVRRSGPQAGQHTPWCKACTRSRAAASYARRVAGLPPTPRRDGREPAEVYKCDARVRRRIDRRINRHGPIPAYRPELGPCWLWEGRLDAGGYGTADIRSRRVRVHRLVYEILVGPIQDGLELDHLCRVRACCNPDHLEPVTHLENGLRGLGLGGTNARKTRCVNGHEFNARNTRVGTRKGRPVRYCRRCEAAAQTRYRQRRAAAVKS